MDHGEYHFFIQANLQHSTVTSGIFTRTVGLKGIDMALVQEQWYHEDCIRGLNIPRYALYSAGRRKNIEPVSLQET